MPNQAARTCIGQHVIEFHRRKPRVQWDRDHAQPGTRIDQLDVFTFIREEKGQPVSSCKTVSAEAQPQYSQHDREALEKSSASRRKQGLAFLQSIGRPGLTSEYESSSVLHVNIEWRVAGRTYFRFESGSVLRPLITLSASTIVFRTPVTVSSKYDWPASTFHCSRVKSLHKPSFWRRFSVS